MVWHDWSEGSKPGVATGRARAFSELDMAARRLVNKGGAGGTAEMVVAPTVSGVGSVARDRGWSKQTERTGKCSSTEAGRGRLRCGPSQIQIRPNGNTCRASCTSWVVCGFRRGRDAGRTGGKLQLRGRAGGRGTRVRHVEHTSTQAT